MASVSYYPPSPPDVPVDLTEPTPAYRQQVALVLISVFVFLLLYFGLLFLSGLLVYKLIAWPVPPGRGGVMFLRILGVIPCALIFLFLLKNLFKFEKAEKSYDIEIFEDDHPRLFDFISRLCDETGAEQPHRVFVRYEVNAGVTYTKSLFHLFWPAKKDLIIGQPVRPFLLTKKLVSGLSRWEYSLPVKWIEKFLKQHGEVQNRINRLHFKSMGGILALQEAIAAEAFRRKSNAAGVPVALGGPARQIPN